MYISNEWVCRTREKACHPNPKKEELLCWGKKHVIVISSTHLNLLWSKFANRFVTWDVCRIALRFSIKGLSWFLLFDLFDGGMFFFPIWSIYSVRGESSTRVVTFHFLLPLKALPQLQVSILLYLPGWIKGEKKNWTGKRESALCVKWVFYFESPTNQSFIFHFQPGVMKESWDKAYAPWVCRPCTLCPLCPRTQPRRRLWPHLHARLQSGSRRGLCLVPPHTQKFWHGEKNV